MGEGEREKEKKEGRKKVLFSEIIGILFFFLITNQMH
jgi:hypothetical protein